jgi:hypothetical protein
VPISIHSYAIYRNPPGYPGKWVVHRYRTDNGGVGERKPLVVAGGYLEAMSGIPKGLERIAPGPTDDATLFETWR